MFTMDGSVVAEKRSFLVTVNRDGQTYDLRLRHKELMWLNANLAFGWGTHTLTLFPDRTLTLRVSETMTSIAVESERINFRIFFTPELALVLGQLIPKMLGLLETDWAALPVEEVFQALGLLLRRGDVALDSVDKLTRAMGPDTNATTAENNVGYGERTGNPPAALAELAKKLLPLLQSLKLEE